jgi:cytochrome c-type biogenesis protein CcmE
MSDGPALDLTPRTGPDEVPAGGRPRAGARGALAWLLIGAVVVGIIVVAVIQLKDSSVYYYNVDEAVAERAEIGDRPIRIQGTVVGDPEGDPSDGMVFSLAFGGESVDVVYSGKEPPDLFAAGVPTVLDGHFAEDGRFLSDGIVIKHTEEYREDNPEHVEDSPA